MLSTENMTFKNFTTGLFSGIFAGIYISQNYEVILKGYNKYLYNNLFQVVDMKSFVNGIIHRVQEYERNKRKGDE